MIFVEEPFSTLLLALHIVTQKYAKFLLKQVKKTILLLLGQILRRLYQCNVYVFEITSELTNCAQHVRHH